LRGFYDKTFRPQRVAFLDRDFTSLNESELALVRNTAAQEKLADAFMTYVTEGKAPSAELRPVFQHFRAWLQKLYQALSGQVDINDEIRGVFDRMLASDQDIRLAEQLHQAQAAEQEALNAVAAKMLTEQEQIKLFNARREAAATSREGRIKKILQAYYRAWTNRNEIKKRAAEAVNALPVYMAEDQAIAEGGLSYDEIRESYGSDLANALLKKRPGLLRKAGTVPLHDLAIAHGFANEEELLDAIREAPGKQADIRRLAAGEIAQREAAIREELDLDEGASPGDPDYYSEQRLEALEKEALALSRSLCL
ncbi:MAG: hypothetical protein LBM64_05995, partial [Deltaproteobacteria bacterium]|nr:hypothetical protein [Deltaproteobacteria bacterium]